MTRLNTTFWNHIGDDVANHGRWIRGEVRKVAAGYVEIAAVDRSRDKRTVDQS